MPEPTEVIWIPWLLVLVQLSTLIFLIIYVVKTWEMASATRDTAKASWAMAEESMRSRQQMFAPQILVYFDPDEFSLADIVVENAGAGTATDVEIRFDPELQSSEDDRPARFFQNPKAVIPPGTRIKHHLDTWIALLRSDVPRRYEVEVAYNGAENGEQYRVQHILDIGDHEHRIQVRRKSLHDLVEVLERWRTESGRRMDRGLKAVGLAAGVRRHRGYDRSPDAVLRTLKVKWPIVRDMSLDGSYQIWWDPALEDLRTEALTALVVCQADDGHEELRDYLEQFAEALLRRATAGDEAWMDEVDGAYGRLFKHWEERTSA